MKKIFFLALLCLPALAHTQEYSGIVQVEGKTADELYVSARKWFAINFSSANNVLQMDDPVSGKLIGKGNRIIEHKIGKYPANITMHFTLSVDIKDGRYRYQIYPTGFHPDNGTEEYSYKLLEEITTMDGLLAYYKIKGIKPGIIGKKQVERNLESNKQIFDKINLELQNIPERLKAAMEKSDDDW